MSISTDHYESAKYRNISLWIRVPIGVTIGLIVIVLSPLIALLAVDYSYIFGEIGYEFKKWFRALREIVVCAVVRNQWFAPRK